MKSDQARLLELYERAERETWSISSLPWENEGAHWGGLHPYVQGEIKRLVVSLAVGEEAVTQTLAPLAHAAPTRAQRLFLCTQLADEARHTMFFQRWMITVSPGPPESVWLASCWEQAPTGLKDLLQSTLPSATERVRASPDDRAAWYRAIVLYHLLLEGIALAAFRSLAQIAEDLGRLPALQEGLKHVIKDESRHLAFGVDAMAMGVEEGFADALAEVLRSQTPLAARRLVDPERCNAPRVFASLNVALGTRLWSQWASARAALMNRLSASGLGHLVDEVGELWNDALDSALAEHARLHGKPHVTLAVRQGAGTAT